MPERISQQTIQDAVAHLRSSDPKMAAFIGRHPECPFHVAAPSPFHVLASSIIGQQISKAAADAIRNRLRQRVGAVFDVWKVSLLPEDDLRSIGLSNAKVRYLRGLAEQCSAGKLDLDTLEPMPDDEIVRSLCELPGVGV